MQLTIFQIRNLPILYIHWLVQGLESFSAMLGPDENSTFDISSRKDGTDHFHHRFLKIDMDNIRLQVKTIVSTVEQY